MHALGLGWSMTGVPTSPIALVVFIKVPWDQSNIKHSIKIELVDGDGHLAQVVQDPSSGQTGQIVIEGDFETGRPPGLPAGTAIDQQMAVQLGPLILPPNQTYEWRMSINGEHHEDWVASFFVHG